jgi:hypothetical protein
MSIYPSKVNYTTGQVLTATEMNEIGQAINLVDGAQLSGAKNRVLNSNMSVWQRGTSFANPANGYTADRWLGSNATAGTITRQVTGDTTNLPFIQYCMRYQRTAASTSTSALNINQSMETVNSIPLAGKAVVLSFYARAGANYSSASNGFNVQLLSGTGTDQNGYLTVYTGNAAAITQTATLTTTWQRFTYTGTFPSTATEVAITMGYTPVGTAGANDYFEITGVQLEAANSVSNYAPNGATYQAELAACQRYYWRNTATNANGAMIPSAFAYSATTAIGTMSCPVTMRTSPTVLETSGLNFRKFDDTVYSMSALTFDSSKTNPNIISIAGTIAGATAGWTGTVGANSNAAAYIGVGAEL